jgi:translation initiation factor 1A
MGNIERASFASIAAQQHLGEMSLPKIKKRKMEEPSYESEIKQTRIPGKGEVIGIIMQQLGFDHVKVKCSDGFTRLCRIPGRMKKRVWLRDNDVVLVVPWDFQYEIRGDVVWRYTGAQADWLQRKGYLKL